MIEQLRKVLDENQFHYQSLEHLRPTDAEIPVIKVTFEGQRFAMWQALKALAPQTGFYPVDLDEKNLAYIIEEQWEPVHRKLDRHETIVLPDLLHEYLLAVNADFLGEKTFHELETECQPMFILEHYGGLDTPADQAKLTDLFLIPAHNSWEALALCDTDGRLSAGPTEIAWARRWAEKYGAYLYQAMGSAAQVYYVERPPSTTLEMLELSNELLHSGFGSDIMEQNFISAQAYAAHLANNHWWEFWWD